MVENLIMTAISQTLLDLMLKADRRGAAHAVEQSLAEGIPPENILHEGLDPALNRIGEMWNRSEISLAQGFVAAKIAEDTLTRCLPGPVEGGKGSVILGNIEEDYHSLGRRMVGAFLQAAGWEVLDLGNDVTAEEFLSAAEESGINLIGASAMMHTTALNIRKLRDLIDSRGLTGRIRLAVGGAVFNWRPDLVGEVGGDGTARNASDADTLFTRLRDELNQGAGS